MYNELEFYTGTLIYKEIAFTFAFDKNELRLIPPEEKAHEIEWEWAKKSMGEGVYTSGDPMPVNADYLIGECNETRQRIVFLPARGAILNFRNSVLKIPLIAYIICKYSRDLVDKVSFSCPEINYIHPTNQAVEFVLPTEEYETKGIITVSTQDFDVTTTDKQKFIVDGKEVKASFGIARTVSTKIHEAPLRLDSSLEFEFEATDDYRFIYRLWQIARDFIRFLCYRNNVFISKVAISAPYEGEKHEHFATMYLLGEEMESEPKTLKEGRYIKQTHIRGHEGAILSDIALNNLYLRHLPETYKIGRSINAARFVMITAAFEWEFHRMYPNGIEKSASTIAVEEAVSKRIQELIDESHGKEKKKYKQLGKLIRSDSLQSEITQIGKDFAEIIGVFGEYLYRLNGEELKYSEMGERISIQRNNFAHGNLDKEFIGLSLLDLIYLEYVVYAMQLKYYGVEDSGIRRAINELFHLSLAIKE